MPYKCQGSDLMHYKNGEWSLKQHCSSQENCKKAMGLLYGLESGSIKKSEVGNPREAYKKSLKNK